MEAVLPKSVDYLDVLPKSVPSERKRRKYYPANGTQYELGQTIIIEVSDSRHFLDVTNSYLQMTVTNNTGVNVGLDYGGASVLIKNLKVQQAGNTIMNIQEYNRLVCGILAPATNGHKMSAQRSLSDNHGYGTSRTNAFPARGGNNNVEEPVNQVMGQQFGGCCSNSLAQFTNGVTQILTAPLFGGLFSQDKLLPLPLLREPLQIIMDLEAVVENLGVFSGDPAAGAGFRISNVTYTAELIDVPRDVLGYLRSVQEMNGGSLLVQAQSFAHNNGVLPGPANGEYAINIPVRRKSIKSVLFVGQGDVSDTVNGFSDPANAVATGPFSVYNLSQSANFLMSGYQIKAGSLVLPPQKVLSPGGRGLVGGAATNVALPDAQFNRGECLFEVNKAMGHLGTAIGSGILNTLTYGSLREGHKIINAAGNAEMASSPCFGADFTVDVVGGADAGNVRIRNVGASDPMEFTPFALDLEAFQNEAVNSGIDTESLGLDMTMILDIDNGTAAQTSNVNLDFFTWHDIIYYFNSDGSITYSQ